MREKSFYIRASGRHKINGGCLPLFQTRVTHQDDEIAVFIIGVYESFQICLYKDVNITL